MRPVYRACRGAGVAFLVLVSLCWVFPLGAPRATVGSGARQQRSVEPMAVTTSPVDETKLNDFLGQMVGDLGAAANAPLMLIGDKLGLYSTCQLGAPVVDC